MRVEPGTVLARLSETEAEDLARVWLDAFAKNAARVNVKAYMWHTFSFGAHPAVALGEAQAEYERSQSPEFVVLSDDRDEALIVDQKPQSCSLSDYHVFPNNLAWSMSFTHEDGGLGPFFAKHAHYEKLNEENLRKLRKAHEAAEATRKGYR
jgi:hypothetical protein